MNDEEWLRPPLRPGRLSEFAGFAGQRLISEMLLEDREDGALPSLDLGSA